MPRTIMASNFQEFLVVLAKRDVSAAGPKVKGRLLVRYKQRMIRFIDLFTSFAGTEYRHPHSRVRIVGKENGNNGLLRRE